MARTTIANLEPQRGALARDGKPLAGADAALAALRHRADVLGGTAAEPHAASAAARAAR